MTVLLLLLLVSNLNPAAVPLVDAARIGDMPTVRALLDQGVDANAAEIDGTRALHWAANRDDVETAVLLLGAGAHVAAANRYGVTPLALASVNGNAAMIELLLEAGADPNTSLPEGETVLMTAARTGRPDAVKALLNHGAQVHAKESWRGQTALMWAAAEGHVEVIQTLVEHGADITARSNGNFTALLFAVREGRISAVQTLLELGANLDESLPFTGRRRGNEPEPESGVNVFLLAAGNAHYELAALLLDRGADPNAAPLGWTALHQISWVRKAGIAGSNPPAPQGSGNMDSLEFVRKLAAHGADLNRRVTRPPPAGITTLNFIGGTPFLLAARTADAELMRLLAELGADPQLTNEDNTTPLMVAAGVGTSAPGEDPGTESEVLEAVKAALELGGDVNAVDNNGETAMHGAAWKHATSAVHFLAEQGAKTEIWNRKNSKGWTPLEIADGIQRGMNIVGSPATAAAIRQVMTTAAAAR